MINLIGSFVSWCIKISYTYCSISLAVFIFTSHDFAMHWIMHLQIK
ncbi:hypothetical protein NC651_010697 [Populus alba x Populus x berolinensis]|nr:hypothetical protein NC651_010697 [Populus alba x Populus x berolinensis]